MQEILSQVSNPFNIENFEIFLKRFCMSENKDYFYESLLNLYHDKSDPKIPNFSEQYSYIPDTEILEGGGWFQVDGLGTFFPVKHRIYINCLNKNLIPLSKKFAGHCIERDLPFVFKADSIGSNRDDALVIYSSTDSYEEYIEILRTIAQESPELIEGCAKPPILTGVLDGWMGLADEDSYGHLSYSQSTINIIVCSIYDYIYQNPELFKDLKSFDRERYSTIIKDSSCVLSGCKTISSRRDALSRRNNNISSQITLDFSDRAKLYGIFLNNPEIMSNIYTVFLSKCEESGRDPSNPIFNNETQKNLSEHSHFEFKDDSELMELMKTADYTTTIAALSKFSDFSDLNIKTKTKILKHLYHSYAADALEDMYVKYDFNFIQKFFRKKIKEADLDFGDIYEPLESLYERPTMKIPLYFYYEKEKSFYAQSLHGLSSTSETPLEDLIYQRLLYIKAQLEKRSSEAFKNKYLQKKDASDKLKSLGNGLKYNRLPPIEKFFYGVFIYSGGLEEYQNCCSDCLNLLNDLLADKDNTIQTILEAKSGKKPEYPI
mgnify:CR=1 FL=1